MKTKIIIGFAVLAIAAVVAFNVNLNLNINQKSELSLLALANVEALASGENNGTPVRNCYKSEIYPDEGSPSFLQPCDTKTTETMIYDCPTEIRGRVYGHLQSKCTTKKK